MNSECIPVFWYTVNSGYFHVVVGYFLSLSISIKALVESLSVLFILKIYFGLDVYFNCFSDLYIPMSFTTF